MVKAKQRQLNITIFECHNLKGDPANRNVVVQLEVGDLFAATKIVSGSTSPVFNENFSVVIAPVSSPDLYLNVLHKADPNDPQSKEEHLGFVKVQLGLFEDYPAKDKTYALEKRSFKDEAQGDLHVKIEYTTKVELDPSESTGFKKSAHVNTKKSGVLEFLMKEADKLRSTTVELEQRVEKAEPQVKELSKQIERRDEMMRQLERGADALAQLKTLEEERKKFQELYQQAKSELENKEVVLRRQEKQIMQLDKAVSQAQRMARKMSVQLTARQFELAGPAMAPPAARQAPAEEPAPAAEDSAEAGAVADAEPEAAPAAAAADADSAPVPAPVAEQPAAVPSAALEGMGPIPIADPDPDDDTHSVDEELLDDDSFGDKPVAADGSNLKGEGLRWWQFFRAQKKKMFDFRDKCHELEALYTEMLLNKQMRAAEETDVARKMERLQALQEENEELKITVKLAESQLEDSIKKYRKEAKERKKLYNEIQELKGNIRVYCRCRPLAKFEMDRGSTDVASFGELDDVSIYTETGQKKTFEFDKCFDPDCTQERVFEDTQPLMQSVLDGFNVCIFAYGQTGSGKTFTMQGSKENPGVNVRALSELFRLVADKGEDYIFEMSISILEIYCDQIRDLLTKSDEKLSVKQEKRGNKLHNYVDGLTHRVVASVDDVMKTIQIANENRSTASTNMNEYSSRSHLVMTVEVATIDKLTTKKTQAALHMIDLAGSERVGRSGVTGQAMKEAQSINQSLSALGNVLAALGRKDNHVPYRNSKLTHVLADALGGNSKVLMFCNISPASDNTQETLSSLQFATRARAVELGKATANVSSSNDAAAAPEPVGDGDGDVTETPAAASTANDDDDDDDAPAPTPAPAPPAAAAKPGLTSRASAAPARSVSARAATPAAGLAAKKPVAAPAAAAAARPAVTKPAVTKPAVTAAKPAVTRPGLVKK